MAGIEKPTRCFRARIFIKVSKVIQNWVLPYLFEIIPKDVAQLKLFVPEKKVTWVNSTIGQKG
jgi:hypothetical protein